MKFKIITLALGCLLCSSAIASDYVPNTYYWGVLHGEKNGAASVSATIMQENNIDYVTLQCLRGNTVFGIVKGANNEVSGKYKAKITVDKNDSFEADSLALKGDGMHILLNDSDWKNGFAKGSLAIIETKGLKNNAKEIQFSLNGFEDAYLAVKTACH